MAMDGNGKKVLGLSPLTLTIIGITTATALLIIYHFILFRLFNRQPLTIAVALGHQLPRLHRGDDHEMQSMENSVAELLPAYKYTKDISLITKPQGGTCAVCLSEFVEGEEVRVLPECLHPFHVDCIDMWLHSHSNCPLCRADTPIRQSVELI